jgi:hypothetical protein
VNDTNRVQIRLANLDNSFPDISLFTLQEDLQFSLKFKSLPRSQTIFFPPPLPRAAIGQRKGT